MYIRKKRYIETYTTKKLLQANQLQVEQFRNGVWNFFRNTQLSLRMNWDVAQISKRKTVTITTKTEQTEANHHLLEKCCPNLASWNRTTELQVQYFWMSFSKQEEDLPPPAKLAKYFYYPMLLVWHHLNSELGKYWDTDDWNQNNRESGYPFFCLVRSRISISFQHWFALCLSAPPWNLANTSLHSLPSLWKERWHEKVHGICALSVCN